MGDKRPGCGPKKSKDKKTSSVEFSKEIAPKDSRSENSK